MNTPPIKNMKTGGRASSRAAIVEEPSRLFEKRGRVPRLRASRQNRGSALLMAVVVLAIAGIGVTAVWHQLHATLGESKRQAGLRQASYLAEAGLEKAVAMLRVNPAYTGETGTPLDLGRFSVSVIPAAPGQYHIVSTGELGLEPVPIAARILNAEITLDEQRRVTAMHWSRRRAME